MEQISIETLYASVKANCVPERKNSRVYTAQEHVPYVSLSTMVLLMKSANYTDEQIKLETGIDGFTWDRVNDEIADFFNGKNEPLRIKVLLCKNYLKINHSINLEINNY